MISGSVRLRPLVTELPLDVLSPLALQGPSGELRGWLRARAPPTVSALTPQAQLRHPADGVKQ